MRSGANTVLRHGLQELNGHVDGARFLGILLAGGRLGEGHAVDDSIKGSGTSKALCQTAAGHDVDLEAKVEMHMNDAYIAIHREIMKKAALESPQGRLD